MNIKLTWTDENLSEISTTSFDIDSAGPSAQEWQMLEMGRVIIFEDEPSVVYRSETVFRKDGAIDKSIVIKKLSDKEKQEIENKHRAMMEMMAMRQSNLVIPGVNDAPAGNLVRMFPNGQEA